MLGWLKTMDERLLIWANQTPTNNIRKLLFGNWLRTITHMGGATFTLVTSLLCALLAPAPWNTTGWQCLTAVVVSHLPVAIVKRKFKRLRPYKALPGVLTSPKPLRDPSFPSGHTTAIFAWLVPILLTSGMGLAFLLPAAMLIGLSVAWSRMYLGLHYPSDVAAGAVIGSATAFAVHYFWITSSTL